MKVLHKGEKVTRKCYALTKNEYEAFKKQKEQLDWAVGIIQDQQNTLKKRLNVDTYRREYREVRT